MQEVPPRFVMTLLCAAALGAPFALVARGAEALLPRLTKAPVDALLRVTAPLSQAAESPPADTDLADLGGNDEPAQLAVQGSGKTPPRAAARPVAKPSALFVSRATVLKLAQSAARPRGSFVAATPAHPAGLRLGGVAGLGIGLQDGDILVEAMGLAPRAPGEIVGAVLEARARRVEALSGTLWRRGQTFRITVQQPY
jgi:hypothetical protein